MWRHNEHDGVSNHQPHDCLLNLNSGADQRNHQRSASLAFVRGIHRWPVNSPHKWPVTRKMFPFDDVIMLQTNKAVAAWNGHVFCIENLPVSGSFPSTKCQHYTALILLVLDWIILNNQPGGQWHHSPQRSCDVTVMEPMVLIAMISW